LTARILSDVAAYLNTLLARADHPGVNWNSPRRAFVLRLLLGLLLAGDTMLTAIVRHFPNKSLAMKHRYKAADRLLGAIDLVPVAAQQTELFGADMDDDFVIAMDLSDIAKPYATKMACLATIYDGSAGDTHARGYNLVTAAAIDLSERRKALPRPLLFEVFSSAEEEFVSQPHVWLEGIDWLCAATPGGVFVIDREADNGRFLTRLTRNKRHFVIRVRTGDSSRNVLLDGIEKPLRIRDAWKRGQAYGTLICERLADDGTRKPYTADYSSLRVRVPGLATQLWLCSFDSSDHEQPLVLLTDQPADTAEVTARVLTQYFARWTVEEMHRFAKQSFMLENIRLLTWNRLKNMVAILWIALGALCTLGHGPRAERVLRVLEASGGRVRSPLKPGQFWGYALVEGLRALILAAPRLLNLLPALWPRTRRSPQLLLPFGGRA